MIKVALNLLNGNEIFQQNLPAIIEVFVQYYGEENRSYIEERFNNMVPICFCKPKERESLINQVLKDLQEKYYKIFMEKYGLSQPSPYLPSNIMTNSFSILERYRDYTERVNTPQDIKFKETVEYVMRELKNRYGVTLSFEEIKARKGTLALDKFISQLPGYIAPQLKSILADEYIDVEETRIKTHLVTNLQKVFPDLTVEKFDEMWINKEQSELKILDEMLKDFETMKSNFLEEIKPLEQHIQYTEKCQKLLEEAKKKNYTKFILNNSSLFPLEEIKILKEILDGNKTINFDKIPVIVSYCGKSLSDTPSVDSFSSASEEILKTDPTNWKATFIKKDRVAFYKKNGIDLGTDYEAYEQNPQAQSIKPIAADVDKFIEQRKQAGEQVKIDYYGSLPDFKQAHEQIDSANLECKDDGYDENTFENTLMCICPNYKKIDGIPVVAPIAMFRMLFYKIDELDALIMHELNHVYELCYVSETEEIAKFSCGWDFVEQQKAKGEVISLEEDKTKRDYELFNEIVNELISQDISRLLHENGIYLYSPKETAKISKKTSYDGTMFIIQDFFTTYLEEIKATRRNNDMSVLFDKIGEENFNEFNELFHIYHKHFPLDHMVYQAMIDYDNGKDTERVRAYLSIIEKRDIILEKMRKHAEEYAMQHESLSS